MRYALGLLLLAPPAAAADPVYAWRSRADEPDRVYLYRDGVQVGGWDYLARQYRPFDGTAWGPPAAAAPVRPPERRVVVTPPPAPVAVARPVAPPLPPLRGPLRVRLATAMGQTIADQTASILVNDVPRALADAVRRGDYQLDLRFSVTRPAPAQPAPSP